MYLCKYCVVWRWQCICQEQLISNNERFKPAFAQRDKKQAKIDLRGISSLLKVF
jgi:hypothetical protein